MHSLNDNLFTSFAEPWKWLNNFNSNWGSAALFQYDKKNLWIKFGDIICKVCVMSLKWRNEWNIFFIFCPKVLHRKFHPKCFSVPSQCPSAFLSLFSLSFSLLSLWISTVFFSPRSFCCVYVFSVWTQRVEVISSKNLILLMLVVLPSCFPSSLHSSVSSFSVFLCYSHFIVNFVQFISSCRQGHTFLLSNMQVFCVGPSMGLLEQTSSEILSSWQWSTSLIGFFF